MERTHEISDAPVALPKDEVAAELPSARRWPAAYALVTSWCRPATTTARTTQVGLVSAYIVHWAALVLGLVAVALATAWYEYRVAEVATSFWNPFFVERVHEILRELSREPGAKFAIVAVGAVVELITLAVALVVAPFGARDERMRDSLRHAVRRTWLQTPHVAVALLAAGVLIAELSAGQERWRQALHAEYIAEHPEPLSPDNTGDAEAMKAYDAQLSAYYARQWEYVYAQRHPWYRVWAEELSFLIAIAACVWLTWGLFRGAGRRRAPWDYEYTTVCAGCVGITLSASPRTGVALNVGRQ